MMSKISRLLIVLAGISLIVSIFVPIWRIELDAPQYPEGLALLIYANRLGGDVEIINGLNHYIGMKTLHAEEFIEFTVLPYIIGAFALFCFAVAWMRNKKLLYGLLILFILFGIVAMADFWRWEYNYGHNLDPNAAIIVPGMAYQPPLIGFKQLLNFGAYSIPDAGGWLFVLSGLMMLFSTLNEMGLLNRLFRKKLSIAAMIIIITCSMSCISNEPEPIVLNKDVCAFCKMSIADPHFGAEVKTTKGRAYKFDDMVCLKNFTKESGAPKIAAYYVHDYASPGVLIDAEKACYIQSNALKSPMGGDMAAFTDKVAATPYMTKYQATATTWQQLSK